MSDSESEALADGQGEAAFVEHDGEKTELPYGGGGVPFYVAIAWVAFVVVYIVVMVVVALPDLRAWMAR